MIKQVCTFHEHTFNIKSYKEYHNGVLIVHTEHDENKNKIYFESNYGNEKNSWFRRKFESGSENDNGEIIFYENSDGSFFDIRYIDGKKIRIKNEFYDSQTYDGIKIKNESIFINVSLGNKEIFNLFGSREIGCEKFNTISFEENNEDFQISYNSKHFDEIYYEDASIYNRKIIHVDEATRLTKYKKILDEFNITMSSKKYRPELKEFRKFIPRY